MAFEPPLSTAHDRVEVASILYTTLWRSSESHIHLHGADRCKQRGSAAGPSEHPAEQREDEERMSNLARARDKLAQVLLPVTRIDTHTPRTALLRAYLS